MPKYITEFIGTFFLVLTVGFAVVSNAPLGALAIGSSLMIMIYMGGHISGGHYNGAVSLAVFLRGKIDAPTFIGYLISQFLGALAAAWIVYVVVGKTYPLAPAATATALQALLVEILYTFALCLVVLNVATSPDTEGNSYYGLAIGFTIVVAAIAGGGISGGAFNPDVGSGPIVVDAILKGGSLSNLWLYIVGPFLGGALAAGVYRLQTSTAATSS
ncbi:MAG TPA: aquaporin [Gemmatimonadaceae bacterium]|nr:aquaporin [Gemmatimonadaceae bacterium]